MRRCPKCQNLRAWTLADGRFKCQSCRARYSWRLVWDSVHLNDETKIRLVTAFARGAPVYHRRLENDISANSKERFYRLLRACCAHVLQLRQPQVDALECAPVTASDRASMRGWATARQCVVLGIRQRANGGLQVTPIEADAATEAIRLLRRFAALGSVYCANDRLAFASLKVQDDHVLVSKRHVVQATIQRSSAIELFWDCALEQLQPFRKIPMQFFQLYLGEVCFRFKHRDRDITPLLMDMLQTIAINDIKPVLTRKDGVVSDFYRELPLESSELESESVKPISALNETEEP